MIDGQCVFAVVPARGGSKGIPRKNLRRVRGYSLVAHAAQIARALPWIDACVLSTDDHEIAAEGRRYGLDVPFLRPADLSGDTALSVDVWRHAWLAAEGHYGRRFDISVNLEPTSPLREKSDVEHAVRTLIDQNRMAIATVSPTPAHFTPHKTLTVSDEGTIGFYLDEGPDFSIRQRIGQYYHRNGVCYSAAREQVVSRRQIVDGNTGAIIIKRPVVNIDEPFDLELAEWLMGRQIDQRGQTMAIWPYT